LLVRDGETRVRVVEGFAVDSLDVDGQELGVIVGIKILAVETGALPLEVQVVLEEPSILLDVGDTSVGSRAGCVITCPFLREMYSIQGNVGSATRLVFSVRLEAQDLEGCEWGVAPFVA
jgi:hypothetical protein